MSEEKPYNLGMSSILAQANKPILETLGDYFKAIFTTDWIFDKWYEKLLITLCFLGSITTIILLILKIIIFKI